MSAKLQELL